MDLVSERCEACRPDSPQVPASEESALLEQIPEWSIVEVNGVKHLKRVIKARHWRPAVELANQIADIADEADHHPSILIEWGKVTVQWWTHAIKGLHRNDFIMAAKVDALLKSD
jgi:4a-hydroxytetrahydrobiopterin dehydratase